MGCPLLSSEVWSTPVNTHDVNASNGTRWLQIDDQLPRRHSHEQLLRPEAALSGIYYHTRTKTAPTSPNRAVPVPLGIDTEDVRSLQQHQCPQLQPTTGHHIREHSSITGDNGKLEKTTDQVAAQAAFQRRLNEPDEDEWNRLESVQEFLSWSHDNPARLERYAYRPPIPQNKSGTEPEGTIRAITEPLVSTGLAPGDEPSTCTPKPNAWLRSLTKLKRRPSTHRSSVTQIVRASTFPLFVKPIKAPIKALQQPRSILHRLKPKQRVVAEATSQTRSPPNRSPKSKPHNSGSTSAQSILPLEVPNTTEFRIDMPRPLPPPLAKPQDQLKPPDCVNEAKVKLSQTADSQAPTEDTHPASNTHSPAIGLRAALTSLSPPIANSVISLSPPSPNRRLPAEEDYFTMHLATSPPLSPPGASQRHDSDSPDHHHQTASPTVQTSNDASPSKSIDWSQYLRHRRRSTIKTPKPLLRPAIVAPQPKLGRQRTRTDARREGLAVRRLKRSEQEQTGVDMSPKPPPLELSPMGLAEVWQRERKERKGMWKGNVGTSSWGRGRVTRAVRNKIRGRSAVGL